MSYKEKSIAREVFSAVPETCPFVDDALEIASEKIKEQTSKFREALFEYVRKCVDLEEKLEDAEQEIKRLSSQVEDLQYELKEYLNQ